MVGARRFFVGGCSPRTMKQCSWLLAVLLWLLLVVGRMPSTGAFRVIAGRRPSSSSTCIQQGSSSSSRASRNRSRALFPTEHPLLTKLEDGDGGDDPVAGGHESSSNNNRIAGSRREALQQAAAAATTTSLSAVAWFSGIRIRPACAAVEETSSSSGSSSSNNQTPRPPTKVLVLGGTGFVGSEVVRRLQSTESVAVVATSTDGRDGTAALNVLLLPQDRDGVAAAVQKLARGCAAVVSCVGAIGTENDDEAINGATAAAAKGAAAAGVERFVYITVAPEVAELARGVDFLQGYLRGKQRSRAAVLEYFPNGKATLIEPTFIYGGGAFELNPPRVAEFYGRFVEGLLASPPLRTVERALPPGLLKLALEPPVAREAVAAAAVAGALGMLPLPLQSQPLDSYDKIRRAAAALAAES